MIETRLIERHIPADLLTCRGVPVEPPPLDTQGAVGAALADALDGWAECHGRLVQVRALMLGAGAPPSP